MRRIKIAIVILSGISLFFIGMSVFADRTTTIGALITIIGFGSCLASSILSVIRTITENKEKSAHPEAEQLKTDFNSKNE